MAPLVHADILMRLAASFALIPVMGIVLSCGHPASLAPGPNPDPQKLPFDRLPRTSGISPTHSVVPSATRIPEGTPITVSLERSLSSATIRANDAFSAVLDEPIVIDGQTLVAPGSQISGQVLEARHAASHEFGYLRIALTTIRIGEKQFAISTSSLFAKGRSREEHSSSPDADLSAANTMSARDVVLPPGRRLNFRLTQNLDLQ